MELVKTVGEWLHYKWVWKLY